MSLKQILPGLELDAEDLLQKLLEYDPNKRLSAEEALNHPYFKELHSEEEEPIANPIDYFDFEFEQYTLDKRILRELILDEIIIYHNDGAKKYYDQCKHRYPNGMLEMVYERKDSFASDEDDVDTQTSSYNNSPEKNKWE